jgi:flagellar basal-body rod protein FlgB
VKIQGIFTGVIPILEKVLDLRSMKHNSIVSNIANMDTPNYKTFDFIVEEELGKAMGARRIFELKKTQSGHLPARQIRFDNVRPKVVASPQYTHRADGNSVDIDREMAKLAENSLMYNALAQILSKKFQGLKNAIEGGGK